VELNQVHPVALHRPSPQHDQETAIGVHVADIKMEMAHRDARSVWGSELGGGRDRAHGG
jgi:hypothetical protein